MASLATFLDIVIPSACAGCGRFGALVCRGCIAAMRPAFDARASFLTTDPSVVLGTDVELAIAALRHEAVTRRCLQRLKYGGARRLAPVIADLALPALDRMLALSGPVTLVPVPLHPVRHRERGYNQALLIARALASLRGLPVQDVLVRRRQTLRQHRLDRNERLQNLGAAMGMRPGATAPTRPLLVDDIITTGATLQACAGVLRRAGSSEVYGLAIAREI